MRPHRAVLTSLVVGCFLFVSDPAAAEQRKFNVSGTVSSGEFDRTIAEWVVEAFHNENRAARLVARATLASIARVANESERKELVEPFSKLLKEGYDENHRNHIIALDGAYALKDPALVPEVLPYLETEAAERAVRTLVAMGDAKAAPGLIKYAQSPKASYRCEAISGLGVIGDQATLQALVRMHEKEKSPEAKESMATAIEALKKKLRSP